jgi:transcription elongation factor GreB
MSKAFTKEDDDRDDSKDDGPDSGLRALSGKRNYMTRKGFSRLKAELHELLHETRPEITKVVAWAASNGDRSENADYLYGKRRLREIDRKIRFLTKRLEIAEVIEPARVKSAKIQFGATVTYSGEDGKEKTVHIVGIDETEPSRGKISWISPLATALLNRESGSSTLFRSPRGEEELEILEVRYLDIP